MEGSVKIHLVAWEDGKKVEKDLEVTDRWEIHAALEVLVTFDVGGAGRDPVTIHLLQEPHALNANRIGVGACVWEGEMLLGAYLCSLPRHRFIGCRCVELGSGPGLVGLLIAKFGGIAHITDKDVVLDLMQKNVDANGLSRDQRKGAVSGWGEVSALEWGKEGYEQEAQQLAAQGLDFVLAADCVYIDNEGSSPSTPHFIQTCAILCSSGTSKPRCLVSFELRSDLVKSVFLEEAGKAFKKVVRINPSLLPKGCQVDHIELYELIEPYNVAD